MYLFLYSIFRGIAKTSLPINSIQANVQMWSNIRIVSLSAHVNPLRVPSDVEQNKRNRKKFLEIGSLPGFTDTRAHL